MDSNDGEMDVEVKVIEGGKGTNHMIFINEDGETTTLDGKGENEWVEHIRESTTTTEDGKVFKKKVVIRTSEDGDVDIDQLIEDLDINIEISDDDGEVEKRVIVKTINDSEIDIETILEDLDINVDVKVSNSKGKGKSKHKVVVKKIVMVLDIEDDDEFVIDNKKVSPSDNTLKLEDVDLYPNPSTGKFTMKFNLPEQGKTTVRVFDMSGSEIFKEKLGNFSGTYEKEIDLTENETGMYLIQVEQSKKLHHKKVIIQ